MLKHSLFALGLTLSTAMVSAQTEVEYKVSITNLTPGQTFTPQVVMTHQKSFRLFSLGAPASQALEIMAESGDTGPISDAAAGAATDVQTIGALLGPGESTSIKLMGTPGSDYLSVAAMLIPTNDTFVALNRVRLPLRGSSHHMVPAYDAGTEENDQSCQHIPGPRCGGEAYVAEPAEGDEGYVHIGNGFHDLGEQDADGFEVLGPKVYDWRNSVARIVVRRVN